MPALAPPSKRAVFSKQLVRILLPGVAFWLLLCIFFVYMGSMLRYIDATAAVLDMGIFSILVFAILTVTTFLLAVGLLPRLWWLLAEQDSAKFLNNYQSLSSWQQLLISVGAYLGLLYAFVLVFTSLV